MRREKGLGDLRTALRSGEPVKVHRDVDTTSVLKSYVVGIGKEWALLNTVSDEIVLNGHSAVRLRDVEHATESDWPGSHFTHRALKLRREHVRPLPQVGLDDIGTLIDTIAAAFPLISVHVEELNPDTCAIGRVCGITPEKSLRIQEISPKAVWSDRCSTVRLADITMIDVGGGYLDALHLVGGAPPACQRPIIG